MTTERSKRQAQPPNTPTQGRFSGVLPVIRGKLTRDEVDSTAANTKPLGSVKDFRDGKIG